MQPQLTTEQYELVLKYMQASSEEDFDSAQLILREYNFNLNTALNARFNQQHMPPNRPHPAHHQDDDEQVVRRYIQFVQRENEAGDVISTTFGFVKKFTLGILRLLSEILLPQFIIRKLIRSEFYNLYKDSTKLNLQDDNLVRLLLNTKQINYKSCIVLISPQNRTQCIVDLLNRNDIVKKIQDSFSFIGFVHTDQQLQQIREIRPPELVICRYDIFKQLKIITRISGQQSISQITVGQLQQALEQGRNMHKQDKNVLVKYRNFIRRQYYVGQMEEEEEEEVNFIARQEDTQHIRLQNQEYERVARQEQQRQEERRREEESSRREQEMLEEKEEERQCRKMSIPDEPTSGNIIRFSFRCPDGSNVNRSFASTQKVELLYHWVETNEQIELEDNKKREFEIMYSYPPTALSSQKDRLINQVFESDHEKLLIREL